MSEHYLQNNCICQRCGIGFYLRESQIKTGRGKFCSVDCKFPFRHDDTADRFFNFIGKKQPNGCILWGGNFMPGTGYGRYKTNTGEHIPAHRLSYELMVGPFPQELFVLHRCDNPPCINPVHLFIGTHQDNMKDMFSKGRHRSGRGCGSAIGLFSSHKGTSNGSCKLSENQVADIRLRHSNGEKQNRLSLEFGISKSSVNRIVNMESWIHLS